MCGQMAFPQKQIQPMKNIIFLDIPLYSLLPLKCRLSFNGLYGVISQKIVVLFA
jgi:hypothetical protein